MRTELIRSSVGQSITRRLVVVGLCLAFVVSGCDQRAANEYASPEAAALAMFSSFHRVRSEPEKAWAFLGPDTRARLEALAAEGPKGSAPTDYLRFGWIPDEALIRSMTRVDAGGRTATLTIETELGDTFEIEMIREDRGWQIELGSALPPSQDIQVKPDVVGDDDEAPLLVPEEGL